MPNELDYEYELKEAEKFRTLAALLEQGDNINLAARFAVLANLAEEKAKILMELVEGAVSDAPERGKLLEWPTTPNVPTTKTAGDN